MTFTVRPLRIAPAIQVHVQIDEFHNQEYLLCSHDLPDHAKWSLRHIVNIDILRYISLNERTVEINIADYVKNKVPGVTVNSVTIDGGQIRLIFNIDYQR